MEANRRGAYDVMVEQTIGPVQTPQVGAALIGWDRRRYPRRIHLTPRECEVLGLLAEGLSNKLICRRLNIAPSTVKIHVARILAELGASTRLQAVVVAQRLGLLTFQMDDVEPQ
jgi:DNA-binding NarL/FixJ family response regulator